MNTSITPEELLQFVGDHMRSKIQHNELEIAGIYDDHDMQLYKIALFEGIINGIVMAGGSVEGIEVE